MEKTVDGVKKKNPGCAIALCIIGFFFGMIILAFVYESNRPQPVKSEKEIRMEKIQGQFSAYDGRHKNLTNIVKAGINDPRAFEHVKTTYTDKGKYLLVRMVFRGKNAFGGIVVNTLRAKVNIDGDVLEILDND